MLSKIVLREHASPTADWEGHLLHPRACALGTVFLDAFHKSSRADSEKDSMLDRCRTYIVACVKVISLIKRLPKNLDLFENFKYVSPSYVRDMPFSKFLKVKSATNSTGDKCTIEMEYGALQAKLPSLIVSENRA